MKAIHRNICVHLIAMMMFFVVLYPSKSKAEELDNQDSVIEHLEIHEEDDLQPRADVNNRNFMCQRYNYDYRRCVSAGCLFDGGTGACYGEVNPWPGPQPFPPAGPNYCRQFNHNQFQCQRAGCYFDQRNGACFDGGHNPPNVPGYRIMCIAVDAGYEEHHRGHAGIGRTRYAAEQAAIGDCLRYHGRCRIRECRTQ